jgi:hypothetical protein
MITDVFIDVLINLCLFFVSIVFSFELTMVAFRCFRKFSGPYGGLRPPVIPSAPAPVSAPGTRHIISAHYVALVVAGRAAQLAIGLPDAHKCYCLSVEVA